MNKLLIISQPSSGRIQVVRAIDPDDGALMMGDVAFNACLVALANSYEEAEQIVENLEGEQP